MIRLLGVPVLFLAFVSCASAQQQTVYRYDDNAINSSVKCELSRVSRVYGPQKPGGPKMMASLTAERTDTTSKKVAGVFIFGAHYEDVAVRTSSFTAKRNINVNNHINCKKSFVVDLGLYDCFMEKRARFFDGQTIGCGGSSSASLDLSVGGSWTLGYAATLQGDLIKKREWTVKVSAPPGKPGT